MAAPARQTPGVNLVGFLNDGFGLGEVARKLAGALVHPFLGDVGVDFFAGRDSGVDR